jgi:hypothetical protein
MINIKLATFYIPQIQRFAILIFLKNLFNHDVALRAGNCNLVIFIKLNIIHK